MVDGGRRGNCEMSGRSVTGKIDHFFAAVSRELESGETARCKVGGTGSSSGSSARA